MNKPTVALFLLVALSFLGCNRKPDIQQQSPKEDRLSSGKALVEMGGDVNSRDEKGNTLLLQSIRAEDKAFALLLIERGADVNAANDEGITPLVGAAARRDKELLQALIANGADASVAVVDGYSPYMQYLSQAEILQINSLSMVELLLANGADVNAKSGAAGTPLHNAAMGRDIWEIADLLLSKGAEVDVMGSNGTALYVAAQRGNLETVRLLIAHGADVNTKDFRFWTPLHQASKLGHEEVVKVLLENGAEVNPGGESDRSTPLHLALRGGQVEIVNTLLESGADPNAKTVFGTPLDESIRDNRIEIMKLLSEHGGKRSE